MKDNEKRWAIKADDYFKKLGCKWKVIVDWTDTGIRDDDDEQIDIYRFQTREIADAFYDGFIAGNGYVSEPQLKVKEIK